MGAFLWNSRREAAFTRRSKAAPQEAAAAPIHAPRIGAFFYDRAR